MRITVVSETRTLTPGRKDPVPVTVEGGHRVEVSVVFQNSFDRLMERDELEKRIRLALQGVVDSIAVMLQVAEKDRLVEKHQPRRRARASNAGPDQVAFAGTDEAAEVDATGKHVRHLKAGKPVRTEAR